MKILQVHVRNFKNIEDLKVDLHGASVYLVGPNQTGKTSFIQAIHAALTGKEIPTEAIRRGSHKATVEVLVGDDAQQIHVELELKQGKRGQTRELIITDPDGEKVASGPRTWLNNFLGDFTVDVENLFSMSKEKMIATVAKSLGVDDPEADKELDVALETRKVTGIELKSSESVISKYVEAGASVPVEELGYPDLAHAIQDPHWDSADLDAERRHWLRTRDVALTKLTETSSADDKLEQHRAMSMAETEAARMKYDQTTERVAATQRRQTDLRATVHSNIEEVERQNREIERLEHAIKLHRREIEKRYEENIGIEQEIERMNEQLATYILNQEQTKTAYHSLLDAKTKEYSELQQSLKSQDLDREKYREEIKECEREIEMIEIRSEFLRWRQQYAEKLRAYKEAETTHEQAQKRVDELRREREERIREKLDNVGIDGLEYDPVGGEFLYQGFELDPHQVNHALLIELALRLVMLHYGKLRVLRIYDAALLDMTTRQRIIEFANSHDYQLFLEYPDETVTGGLEVRFIQEDYIDI